MEDIVMHTSGDENHTVYHIMEINGDCYSEFCAYKDEPTTFYLNKVSVSVKRRGKRMAAKLIELHVQLGRELGFIYSCLQVERGTWMLIWYLRIGYDYYPEDNYPGWVWLRKTIK